MSWKSDLIGLQRKNGGGAVLVNASQLDQVTPLDSGGSLLWYASGTQVEVTASPTAVRQKIEEQLMARLEFARPLV